MGFLNAIMQPELIAVLISVCAIAGMLYALSRFVGEKVVVQQKFDKVEAELSKLRRFIQGKKEKVSELQEQLEPLKSQEAELRPYYEELQKIRLDAEREEQTEEDEKGIHTAGRTPAKKEDKTIGRRKSEWE